MGSLVSYAVSKIAEVNPKHGHKLEGIIASQDAEYRERAEEFFGRYDVFLRTRSLDFDYGVNSYLKLCQSMKDERARFLHTGEYASKSFAEVAQRVYNNREVMEHHMHGLVFAQFFWIEQYERFRFFCNHLPAFRESVRHYLEIGGGHGLYLMAAQRLLDRDVKFDVIDVSPSSLELAKGIVQSSAVHYRLGDIHDFPPSEPYDFITMGEVLEHVEQPLALLRKVRTLLRDHGHAYITTPINAPTLDHIYLFRCADEIRAMLKEAGFYIEREITRYAEDMAEERARKLQVSQMFGAFVRPS